MKRYILQDGSAVVRSERGDWVRYADVEAMLDDEKNAKSLILLALAHLDVDVDSSCRLVDAADYLKSQVDILPANWTKNSSLETWFPLTAWEIGQLKREYQNLREAHGAAVVAQAEAVKRMEKAESQLRLCEEHAGTMAKDFDASLAVVQKERDFFASNATFYQRKCDDLEADWAPIDTAPKGPKSILAYSEENMSMFIVFWHDGWRDFYSCERCKYLLTHWKPLPERPL